MKNYIISKSIQNKRIILRVDYNVPILNNKIVDNYRIIKSIPTIKFCLENNASIVIISHLGRPHGKVEASLSLRIVKKELEQLLNQKVFFSNDCISESSIKISKNLQPREIHLLENLRFYNMEIENDNDFSKKLAKHGKVFVNDAFGTAHRAHASNVGITNYTDNNLFGFLMSREYEFLHNKLNKPTHPYTVVLGGSKVTGKIELIRSLIKKADNILIGGAMAFTFLKAKGIAIGKSYYEPTNIEMAKVILGEAVSNNVKVVLPNDIIVAQSIDKSSNYRLCKIDKIDDNMCGYDIGPQTCNMYNNILDKSQTIVWNGPLGVAEVKEFSNGTKVIADTIHKLTKRKVITIIGGGDTASTVKKISDNYKFSHISTGGGASLELISGNELPAFKAIYG